MPYTPEHKQATRRKIVDSARRLFNQRGFSEVSIDEIMAGAGLTRGGFYNHFSNKEDLYAEAITFFIQDQAPEKTSGCSAQSSERSTQRARYIIESYLSKAHQDGTDQVCPLVALPSDVARGGSTVKAAYREVLQNMISTFEAGQPHAPDHAREHSLAMAALCVGGMVLARGIDDRDLAEEIRHAAKVVALVVGGFDQAETTPAAAE